MAFAFWILHSTLLSFLNHVERPSAGENHFPRFSYAFHRVTPVHQGNFKPSTILASLCAASGAVPGHVPRVTERRQ